MADIKVEIKDNTDECIRAKDQAVLRALEMLGMQCENYATLKCPVDTGRLRASITHEVHKNEEAVYVGTNVEYAPYVEFGTSRMKAQPYIKPAATEHTEEYKRIVETCLKG